MIAERRLHRVKAWLLSPKTRPSAVKQLVAIFGILFISAVLIVLLFLAYYMTGERFSRKASLVFPGKYLVLNAGEGERRNEGLIITQLSELHFALVNVPLTEEIHARRYSGLQWFIEGLQPSTQLRLVWAKKKTPQITRDKVLPYSGGESGQFALDDLEDWQDAIISVGLMIRGPLPEPLVIRGLVLKPVAPGPGLLLAELWREWTTFEGWQGYSINFIIGSSYNALFPPVLAVAAWIGLSSLLYTGLALARWQSLTFRPVIIFFLVGWLVLDARWQVELWRKLQLTYQQYGGKSFEDKQLAANDGDLYAFVTRVKQQLPSQPIKLLLLTDENFDPGRYRSLRARYHLLPHNVFLKQDRAHLDWVLEAFHSGDYVLILGRLPWLRFQPQTSSLNWAEGHRQAEVVLYTPNAALYRLR